MGQGWEWERKGGRRVNKNKGYMKKNYMETYDIATQVQNIIRGPRGLGEESSRVMVKRLGTC